MKTHPPSEESKKFRDRINTELFAESSPLNRIFCLLNLCDGIGPHDGEFTEDALVNVLENDTDPIVRHEAAFTLYKLYNIHNIRGERALVSLCNSARNDESTVARHEAAESLGFFHHPKSLQTLQELLNDPNPDVVATAKISLERISRNR